RGRLFPQGRVRAGSGAIRRFDDLWGGAGFRVVTVDPDAVRDDPGQAWDRVAAIVLVRPDGAGGDGAGADGGSAEGGTVDGITVTDGDGVYLAWFAEHDCAAAVVRPDGYVFGTARDADELSDVVADLDRQVSAGAPGRQ
ncbi:MAG TPA: hypothetical protein VHZ33_21835, partial [Trebonia sp.]|nr:hypothetical protein [Trebonia sp.]